MTSVAPIGQLRLAALRLVGAREPTVAAAARWCTATQGQDLPGAQEALALRVAGGTTDAVRAAFDAGEVVRSWPMRGTLHVVAAEDLAWMLPLGTPRPLAAAATRRTALGLTDETVERARAVTVEALAGGGRMRRRELFAAWAAAGLSAGGAPLAGGGPASHTLGVLAQTGTVCLGPFATATEQAVVLLDEWVPAPRRPSREEALVEWARRYLCSHGPASLADYARWTGLAMADVRAGVAGARADLAVLDVDGVEMFMAPDTPDRLAAARAEAAGELRLPGFDEFVLGYRDRSHVLDDAMFRRIVPGGNGVFRPTVVHAGRVVDTWRRDGSAS